MPKQVLTDRTMKALRPAPAGKRLDFMDAVVPGFGVRVTDKADASGKAAQRTFILVARFPGSANPTRRAIGEYGKLSLDQARDTARSWHEMIRKGVDPREDADERRDAEQQRRANTFGGMAEAYIERRIRKQRRAVVSEREIRNELIDRWADRPVTSITKADVIAMVDEIAARAPRQAHNVFGHLRTMLNWAIERDVYGIETSPCDRVKPARLIGAKNVRQRVLTDDELRAIWLATRHEDQKRPDEANYPFGALVRLLMLTGQRKAEVAEAQWREFDLARKLWTIPPERFKSNATHVVPLSADAIAVVDALPRFRGGDFLFSTTHGQKAVNGFSNAKRWLDRAIAEELGTTPEPWVLHDIRRTVRTRLSGLRISEPVAEMVIGHARKGLARVYDQHQYLDEMREALDAWAMRLRSIVEPTPANVVDLRARVS